MKEGVRAIRTVTAPGIVLVGFAASALALVATLEWAGVGGHHLGALDYLIGGAVYFATGLMVGSLANRFGAAEVTRSHPDGRAKVLAQLREQQTEEAIVAERARLARELHDVVAHSVSVMTVQAAGARRVLDEKPAQAAEAIEAIETAGRQALEELRRLLIVLRKDERIANAFSPQPRLDALSELVAEVKRTGVMVDLRIEGQPVRLSPSIDLTIYRIAQEALTNVVKHAGKTRAHVLLCFGRDEVRLRVANEMGSASAGMASCNGHHGIAGMRERITFLGGELEAGPDGSGGYTVDARVPLNGSA